MRCDKAVLIFAHIISLSQFPDKHGKKIFHNRISTDAQFSHTNRSNVRHRKAVWPTESDDTVARPTADIRPRYCKFSALARFILFA